MRMDIGIFAADFYFNTKLFDTAWDWYVSNLINSSFNIHQKIKFKERSNERFLNVTVKQHLNGGVSFYFYRLIEFKHVIK